MMYFTIPRGVKIALICGALTTTQFACGAGLPEASTCPTRAPASLRIVATDHMNPSTRGEGLATELRLYQLRDARALDGHSFEDLWHQGGAALGESLVSEETLTVYPGETTAHPLTLQDGALYLGAVVIVRQPEGRSWTTVTPLTDTISREGNQPTNHEGCPAAPAITLRIDGSRIESFASNAEAYGEGS